MSTQTHNTAVVVIPDRACWEPIQAIRRRYDRHVRRWMPHITLLYPFRPKREFDALAGALARVCKSLPPFEVCLSTFRWFRHRGDSYTLWLDPEPRDPLVALQTALWRVVPDCDHVRRHPSGYTPHLSVGQLSGRTSLESAVSALRATWRPLRFRLAAVSLIWRPDPPDDVFRVVEQIALGDGPRAATRDG